MKYVRHKKYSVVPMVIIDVDHNMVVDHLFETSKSLSSIKKNGIIVNDIDVCCLDPGGVVFLKEKPKTFKINGFNFEILLSKIGSVKYLLKNAQDRIPNCKRIAMFRYNIVCSNLLYEKILSKINKLYVSDEALHAQITDSEMKEILQNKNMLFLDIPKEENNGS